MYTIYLDWKTTFHGNGNAGKFGSSANKIIGYAVNQDWTIIDKIKQKWPKLG